MTTEFNKVCVVGLGYIGLPTAAVLASRKINVIGLDVNSTVVETVNQGEIHIVEPDLDIVVRACVSQGYLRATLIAEPADAFLLAVPTPFVDDHQPDLKYVESATRTIAKVLEPGNLIVLESTSPVGTTELVAKWLRDERPDLKSPIDEPENPDIHIAHCPERVLPGHVLTELIQNDRVIGGLTEECSNRAKALYRCFVEAELIATDARTAEMCKLTENSFRDVNIAFANELSVICDKFDINVWELISLANHHPRVNILQPGTGVGGHCIAVDPWFIVSSAPDDSHLIKTARETNDEKPHFVAEKIASAAAHAGTKKVNCLGLAFKPDIDDLRESPAIEVVRLLAEQGLELTLVEPNIVDLPAEFSKYKFADLSTALADKDAITAILVAHTEFRELSESTSDSLDFCGVTEL